MSYLTQKTIKKEVSFSGVALHSGLNVNICIKPAAPNFGIVFNLIPLCILTNFGLIGFGILIFLLTNTSTSKSFLFPVIFFPIIIPILINSSNIALGLIIQDTASLYIESWLILLTFALLGVLLGINLFGRLIKQ